MFRFLFGITIHSQEVPTVSAPPNGGQNNPNYWSRSGNLGNGNNNQNNIFGTKWNSPIYTVTGDGFGGGNNYRMKLNGLFTNQFNQYSINGFSFAQGVNTTGYLLLGERNNSMTTGEDIYFDKGAYSLLHLNGQGSQFQEFGYRPWMKTGITFTGNRDLSYMGLRKLSTNTNEEDITETVFLWSDNANNSSGPDKLVFRFSGYGGIDGGSVSSNRISNTDLDGLHVAQFTGFGLMGLGNTFGTNAAGMNAANYIEPQSLMHMSYDWRPGNSNEPYGFLQITYRRDQGNVIGVGETTQDGLRLGIDNTVQSSGGQQFLSGYLRWQENSPFIVQTDWNNNAGGINNGERLRVCTIGSPGVPNPAGAPNNNITRVAISHRGNEPVTEPRSLLHLGYNTSGGVLNATDGWRDWMDVGTYTNIGSDNMYIGMKPEGNDRFDAIINWGDNQVAGTSPNGPDYLRFIFTSTTTALPPGQGDPVSQSNDGLEVMRMDPGLASTLPNTNYGMVGIGNFSNTNPNNPAPIDAKLDIDGDLRIREVTQDNSLTRFLVIDPNDENRVHYADFTIPQNTGQGFEACPPAGNPNLINSDVHINLNDNNLYFEGNNPTNTQNNVGIGHLCGTPLKAKLSVLQQGTGGIGVLSEVQSNYVFGQSSISPTAVNGTCSGNGAPFYIGLVGDSYGFSTQANYGVYARAVNGAINYAGYFDGEVYVVGSVTTMAGNVLASDQMFKNNINDLTNSLYLINQLQPRTYEFDTINFSDFNFETDQQMGLIAQEVEQVLPNIVSNHVRPAQYDSLGNIIAQEITYKGVEYEELIPLLIGGIKEQQSELDEKDSLINDLNVRLSNLENCLSGLLPILCQINNSSIEQTNEEVKSDIKDAIEVHLSDRNNIVLNQNVPNPFAERTVITYSIPETVEEAQIHFYDASGKLIETVVINDRGNGQLNVFANDLSTGVYTYSLVADGRIVATKRMMKE